VTMAAALNPAQTDIRIARFDQLFQTFDPSPFRERDLDPDATAYIVDWVRELNHRVPIEIHLKSPSANCASCFALAGSILRSAC